MVTGEPMVEHYALMFSVSFIYIFLKSFQQLNVVWKKYWWVMPISYCLAFSEALLWIQVVNEGIGWGVFWMGTGAGLGCMLGMYSHLKVEKFLGRLFDGKT